MSPPLAVCQSASLPSMVSAPSFTFHALPILSELYFRHPLVVFPSNRRRHPFAFSASVSVLGTGGVAGLLKPGVPAGTWLSVYHASVDQRLRFSLLTKIPFNRM